MILRRPFRVPLFLILLPLCLASLDARAERRVKEEAKPNQPLVSPGKSLVSPAKPMVTGGKTLNPVAPSQPLGAAADKPLAAAVATNTLSGAQALHRAKNYAAALAACDAIIAKGGLEERPAQKLKAQCLCALQRYPEAVACWTVLLERDLKSADNDDLLLQIARIYAFSMKDPVQGRAYYERLFKEWPNSALTQEAQYQYAGSFFVQEDYATAMALLAQFVTNNPNHSLASKAKDYIAQCKANGAQVVAPPDPTREPEKPRLVAAADARLATENAHLVSATQPLAVSRTKEDLAEGEAYFGQSQYPAALRSYQQVKNAGFCKESDLALYRMGHCYSALGDDRKAIKAWEEVLNIPAQVISNSPYCDDALWAMGETWLDKLADPQSAIKPLERLVTEYTNSPLLAGAQAQLGIAYLHVGKVVEAQAVLVQAVAAEKPDPDAPPSGVKRLLLACGRKNPFLPELKMTAAGNRAAVQLRLGDLYFTLRDYAKARKAYEKAQDLAPETEEAAYARLQTGRCYNQLGQYDKALHCYRKFLLEQYKGSEWADDALARAVVVYVGPLHDVATGKKVCDTILERWPKGDMADTAQFYLATLAYWEQDWKEAAALHEQLLEKYPMSRYAEFVGTVRLPEINQKWHKAKGGRS